ncbi:MAG: hypothetical protein FJ088_07015 [Deltaproteobacteria bacterium]|nr:hypothetical protein [Deltaproteobacteria bacterium]
MFNKILFAAVVFLFSLASACGGGGDGKCDDDYDCGESLVCNPETGGCEPFVCKTDDECADPSKKCVNNKCV